MRSRSLCSILSSIWTSSRTRRSAIGRITRTLILGGSFQLTKRTETSLAYTFTRTNARIHADGLTASTLDGWSRFRNDIHRVQFEIGHWLREGLRLSFGYSYDKYDDRTQIPTGVGSADPFDPSTDVHTFMFGVTLNSDLLR